MADKDDILKKLILKLVSEDEIREEFFFNREKVLEEMGCNLTDKQKELLNKLNQEDFETYIVKQNDKISIDYSVPIARPPFEK